MINTLEEIKSALANCTKGKWEWYQSERKRDLGKIISTFENGKVSEICWFGNSEHYYPTEGEEPDFYDREVMVNAPQWLSQLVHRVEELEYQLNSVNQALKDAKGEPSLTSEGLIAWLYSTLPFLEEE